MSKLDLDLTESSVQSGRVVVPTGNYPMEVVGSDLVETKAKNGWIVVAKLKIISGDHSGSVLIHRFNIANTSKQAQDIGKDQLKTLLTVAGFANPNLLADTDHMIGLKFNAYVEEEEHTFTGKDGDEVNTTQNEIKSYFPLDLEVKTPVAVATNTKVAAPAPTAAPSTAPTTVTPIAAVAPAAAFPWAK